MPFISPDGPAYGYFLSCERHQKHFIENLASPHPGNIRALMAWLYRSARLCGIKEDHILEILAEALIALPERQPSLDEAIASLTEDEIAFVSHPPEWAIGQRVRVILNTLNLTPREGEVHDRIWHHMDKRWLYFIIEKGKRISKRYYADDFQPL